MSRSSRSRSARHARALGPELGAPPAGPRRRGRRSRARSPVPARRFRSCLPPVRIAADARAALDPERARPLGPVELVRRERQQIDAERPRVDRNLRHRLHGVGVEERAARVRERRQFGNRLDGADFVIGVHHRDERRLVGQRRLERGRRDDPAGVDRQQRRAPAAACERLERVEHRLVLDRRGNQMALGRWARALRRRREWRSCRPRCRRS